MFKFRINNSKNKVLNSSVLSKNYDIAVKRPMRFANKFHQINYFKKFKNTKKRVYFEEFKSDGNDCKPV